jgi:hypothetical protein
MVMSLLEEPRGTFSALVEVDEHALRQTLRGQISHLERELIATATSTWPYLQIPAARSQAGPRVLSSADLERVRDELAGKLSDLRTERHAIVDVQTDMRNRLERMLLEPGKYKFERISGADIGEPGCKHWHVRPRLGIIGMLAGWWHVKVSSGCPLAWGPWQPPRPRRHHGKAIT